MEENGFADNTLLIFTSDNGSSKAAGIPCDLRKQGHHVSAHFRGSKADIWDGGHRVPFVVRWPGKVEAGSRCDQLITLVDFFATASEITGEKAPEIAEDSVSFLPALSGKPIVSTRKGVIHHSISGHFAYRQGKWKLLLARGSGGWSSPKERDPVSKAAPEAQLYDMEKDPSEQNNLYLTHPEIAEALLADLTSDVERGRSTDGPEAKNDVKTSPSGRAAERPQQKKLQANKTRSILLRSSRSTLINNQPSPMKRLTIFLFLFFTLHHSIFCFLSAADGAAAAQAARGCAGSINIQQPNILFIMLDDLGKEWISCYGAEDIKTPNIDALAAGGMKFHNAYSMPQCTPSRATLLTGKYPWRNGFVNHWDVPRWGIAYFDWKQKENTTFARLMKDLGYATFAAGKWQINDFRIEPQAMKKHGFDDWAMWTGYEAGNPPSDETLSRPIHQHPGGQQDLRRQVLARISTPIT